VFDTAFRRTMARSGFLVRGFQHGDCMNLDPFWQGWLHNITFWSGFFGWVLAQLTKMSCSFARTRKMNFSYLVSTGGMPSAHSSMASALVTSVALREGTSSVIFVVTLAFALVVMFDAQSFRRAAGMQARILNQMIDELFKGGHFSEQKLVELLGHTRIEVFLGAVMGVLTSLLLHSFIA
jgi:uncharacterized protein